jgi:hypothetical protein
LTAIAISNETLPTSPGPGALALSVAEGFWLRVMNELKNRDVDDVLFAAVDGLKGFPDAITATLPKAIDHLHRGLRKINKTSSAFCVGVRPRFQSFNYPQVFTPSVAPNAMSVGETFRHITVFPDGGSWAQARLPPSRAIFVG